MKKSKIDKMMKRYGSNLIMNSVKLILLFFFFLDLLPSSERFIDVNVTSFSRILFDVSRNQMIVGAR